MARSAFDAAVVRAHQACQLGDTLDLQAFAFVLEYLRSLRSREADTILPPPHLIAAVLTEAKYYQLPGGLAAACHTNAATLCTLWH